MPLPAGYTLDSPSPTLPPGYTLDSAQPPSAATANIPSDRPKGFADSFTGQLLTPASAITAIGSVAPEAVMGYSLGSVNATANSPEGQAEARQNIKQGHDEFIKQWKAGNYLGAARSVQDTLLGAGVREPVDQIESQIGSGDYPGAAGTALGAIAPLLVAHGLYRGVAKVANVASDNPVTKWALDKLLPYGSGKVVREVAKYTAPAPEMPTGTATKTKPIYPPPPPGAVGTFENPTPAYTPSTIEPIPPPAPAGPKFTVKPASPGGFKNPPARTPVPGSQAYASRIPAPPAPLPRARFNPATGLEEPIPQELSDLPATLAPPIPPVGIPRGPSESTLIEVARSQGLTKPISKWTPSERATVEMIASAPVKNTPFGSTGIQPINATPSLSAQPLTPPQVGPDLTGGQPLIPPAQTAAQVPSIPAPSAPAGLPDLVSQRYVETGAKHADIRARNTYDKNTAIAQHLIANNVTPETLPSLSDDAINSHIKTVNAKTGSNYKPLGAGSKGRGEGRTTEQTRADIALHMNHLLGRLQ